MEKYKKPTNVSDNAKEGAIPFAVAAAAGKVVASKSFAVGATVGLSRGRTLIDPNHTRVLNG